MLIGKKYSDNKMYRGMKHSNELPLTVEDLHEYSDTSFMKNSYIMNNIVGYGILNKPKYSISNLGLHLSESAAIMIDGDVCLVNSEEGTPILPTSVANTVVGAPMILCIVGWYQHLDASSTLRNYGGVNNSIIPNDLTYEKLGVQVSSRYQFRWDTIIVSEGVIESDMFSFTIPSRDAAGKLVGGNHSITTTTKVDSVFTAATPTNMSYAISDLYIIPILKYVYDGTKFSSISNILPVVPKGSIGFIQSETQPVGDFIEGTIWYKPSAGEFSFYVKDEGFVLNNPRITLRKTQFRYSMTTQIDEPEDISISITGLTLSQGDIIQVEYNGLVLLSGKHYTIDYTNNNLILEDFVVDIGDEVVVSLLSLSSGSL